MSHPFPQSELFINRTHASEKMNSRAFNEGIYFPFGDEREKLKSYVFEQLHGDEAAKNAEILNKFREEAAIRRHNHLHRISFTEQSEELALRKAQNQQILRGLPMLNPGSHQFRFANYYPRQYKGYSLVPTLKAQPPIYNFSSLDTHEKQQTKRGDTRRLINPETSVNLFQTVKNKHKSDRNRPFHHRRSESLDVNSSYKDKALMKIKQIAREKKGKVKNKEDLANSTDSSEILQQLEYKKQVSKVQFKHLEKQVKKFHKYRNYLRNAERYKI